MEVAYVISPYRGIDGDYGKNEQYTLKAAGYLISQGFIPVVPHLYLPRILDDNDEKQRERALQCGLKLLEKCDFAIVFSDLGISEGMRKELEHCKKLKKPFVIYKFQKRKENAYAYL